MAKQKLFDIISPDGFPFNIDPVKEGDIQSYFETVKDRYKHQGFYSSVHYGRITLDKLDRYCELQPVNQ